MFLKLGCCLLEHGVASSSSYFETNKFTPFSIKRNIKHAKNR